MTDHSPCTVRRSVESDAPAILAIRSHPAVRRFQPMIPGTPGELQQKLARRGSLSLTPDQAGKLQWTIVNDDLPIGWVSVDVTMRAHHIANLGYALDPSWHGRGIATAAVREVIPIVLDPQLLAIERLEAVAAATNIASRRVLEKCGFELEGISRGYLIIAGTRVDHARYALMRR